MVKRRFGNPPRRSAAALLAALTILYGASEQIFHANGSYGDGSRSGTVCRVAGGPTSTVQATVDGAQYGPMHRLAGNREFDFDPQPATGDDMAGCSHPLFDSLKYDVLVGDGPGFVAVGDLDGVNGPDLAVTNSNDVLVLLNRCGSGAEICPDDDGDGFVTLCHVPPGRPGLARTMTVPVEASAAHLAHGDACGSCDPLDSEEVHSKGTP